MTRWWLSFADPDKPEGEQFLGVTIVEAPTILEAIRTAHRLGANPGGEVLAIEIQPSVVIPDGLADVLHTSHAAAERLDMIISAANSDPAGRA